MQKPAEVRKDVLYVYGVRVTLGHTVEVLAKQINAAAAAYREDAVLAIKAGGCA